MKFGVDIPQSHVDALEARAQRLANEVDRATTASSDRRIRDTAGHLVDRILEWVEEIKELREVGDEDVIERIKSFQGRLALAESHVASWPMPADKRASGRRRRKRERKAA